MKFISKSILVLINFSLLFTGTVFAGGELELQFRASKPEAIVTMERVIDDDTVILSVSDAASNPIFGLTNSDFVVMMGGRTAKITSVKPIAESMEVPRNIVLILDNSYSMQERDAIVPLLAGVDELLKIVRPIDQVQTVVFSDEDMMNIGGRDLHVRTFKSNHPIELKNFVANVYRDGITSTTVLYEGMLAGLDLIRTMPENEPRFMVVFSDGEDLNSAYKSEDVFKATEGLARFNAYAIDFMPVTTTDKFLKTFSERNHGQIWKATSETNLVPIFQSVASKMQYYYVVSYLFPTTGSLAVAPATLNIDEIEALDALSQSEMSAGAAPGKSASVVSRIDTSELTLRPVVDTTYGILLWKVTIANSDGTLAEQAGVGPPAAEIVIPLKTDDLSRLAVGGDIKVTMELQDRKGQNVVLNAPPVKVNHFRTTGSLAVAPATLNIDEIEALDALSQSEMSAGAAPGKSASVVSRIDTSELTLRPVVDTAHGISHWKVILTNTNGTLAEQVGEGAPATEIVIPLKTDDLSRLAVGGDIKVTMELQDRKGQNVVLNAPPVKVNHFRTTGSLAVAPASLKIEEIKTIDASPMLGHIYFSKGTSELPAQYISLTGLEETVAFDEQSFRDTLEKYYQVLNIIGKRLVSHPEATITLTGCNANIGVEKGNLKLSNARAEVVRDYLRAVWGIAPERFRIEVRNLPKMPSTSKLEEGQADNRRVEINSDDLAILDLIRSMYLNTRIDTATLTLHSVITAAHGIARWKVILTNTNGTLAEQVGEGAPAAEIVIPLKTGDLSRLAVGGDIKVTMELQDRKGQELAITASPVKVNFIQASQLLAKKQGFRIQEKYALILFDFDSDTIDTRNQEIVNKIVTRIKALPQATVDIVGHTDNIGKEDYNIKLSERRALAVYKLLTAAYGEDPDKRIRHRGVGPSNPLYDNTTSEARAFNRTVTITLEYLEGNKTVLEQ